MQTQSQNETWFVSYLSHIILRLHREFPLPVPANEWATWMPVPVSEQKLDEAFTQLYLDNLNQLKPQGDTWIDQRSLMRVFDGHAFDTPQARQLAQECAHNVQDFLGRATQNPDQEDSAQVLMEKLLSLRTLLQGFHESMSNVGADVDAYLESFQAWTPWAKNARAFLDDALTKKGEWLRRQAETNRRERAVAAATKTFLVDIGLVLEDAQDSIRLSPAGYQFCFSQAPVEAIKHRVSDKLDPPKPSLSNLDMLRRFTEKIPEHAGAELGAAIARLGLMYIGLKS